MSSRILQSWIRLLECVSLSTSWSFMMKAVCSRWTFRKVLLTTSRESWTRFKIWSCAVIMIVSTRPNFYVITVTWVRETWKRLPCVHISIGRTTRVAYARVAIRKYCTSWSLIHPRTPTKLMRSLMLIKRQSIQMIP